MTVTQSGPVALVGSGEFTPAMLDVDCALFDGVPRRVAHLATAAAPEGEARLAYWADLARRHYAQLDAEVDSVPVVDRASADDRALAKRVAAAGLIYLSGGNPGYLADTLRGTACWDAVLSAHAIGMSVAGCSAGASALTALAPDSRTFEMRPGLGLDPGLAVISHYDRMLHWWPDAEARHRAALPPGATLVGIDEDTALVGGRGRYRVRGTGTVSVLANGGARTFAPEEWISFAEA